MENKENDYVALFILSFVLLINMCCCNIVSCILGITSLINLYKYKTTKNISYINKSKIMILIGFIILALEIIFGYIFNITDILLKII